MSWFGGGKKSEKARKKQIHSLEAKDGKSYKVYKMARNHFRVTFQCRGFSDPLAIQIHFSDDFPDSPPKISVDRKYSHHLLDDNGVVTKLDELNKWSPHSDLGNIVQKITNMFNISQPTIKQNYPSGQPPQPNGPPPQQPWGGAGLPSYNEHASRAQSQPHSQQPPNYPGPYGNHGQGAKTMPHMNSNPYQPHNPNLQNNNSMPGGMNNYNSNYYGSNNNNMNNSYSNNMNNNNGNNRRQSQHQHEPTTDLSTMKLSPPSIIPGFAEKTLTELQEMDKEPQLVTDFAYEVASTLREMKRDAQNGCLATAQNNVAEKEKLTEMANTNNEIRTNMDTLTELYKNLKKREEKVLQKFSYAKILQALDKDLDAIDEKCEALKDKFQEGDITYVIYAKKLTKLRTEYHILSIKKEKLQIRLGGHF